MGKEDADMRLSAVVTYPEDNAAQEEVSSAFGISSCILRRWLCGSAHGVDEP